MLSNGRQNSVNSLIKLVPETHQSGKKPVPECRRSLKGASRIDRTWLSQFSNEGDSEVSNANRT